VSADPIIVCVDTFENDDISGCFPATTTTTTTVAMATELPATATDVTVPLGVIAAAALLVGIIMARIAS